MDADRFDTLARALSDRPHRRRALGLALGAALAAAGLRDASAKKKPNRKPCGPCKRRAKGKCVPKRDGAPCGGACTECRGGACRPRATGVPCGTCKQCALGSCVTAADGTACDDGKTCQSGACTCPPTKETLQNGSCATVCPGGSPAQLCPGCGCNSLPNTEGIQVCVKPNSQCADLGKECASTADCPVGQHCQSAFPCDGPPTRCAPLCAL